MNFVDELADGRRYVNASAISHVRRWRAREGPSDEDEDETTKTKCRATGPRRTSTAPSSVYSVVNGAIDKQSYQPTVAHDRDRPAQHRSVVAPACRRL